MLSHSQSLFVVCTGLALIGSASAFSVQNHHLFSAAKSSNFKCIPKKNQIPFKTTRLESLLPHANDNEKPSLSKRERVRRKGKQIFLAAAFSTSMIFRGTAQPANAWGREEAATVKSESKIASSNVFPVVATVGGIVLAKKLLSKDDSDDEVDTIDDNKETLKNLMSAKKDITESEDLKHAAAQREARRNARIEEDSRRAAIEQARREEEARKIADQLKAEKGAKLKAEAETRKIADQLKDEKAAKVKAEAEAKANADAVSMLKREEEEQARCEEEARKIADELKAELGAKLEAEEETRKIADRLKDEKAALVKAEAEAKANADAVSRLKREEEERAAAEEAAKRAAEEYKILAAEAAAKAEEERLAAEVAAEKEEEKRLAAEAAAKAEEERLAVEAAVKEEEDRKAAEEVARLRKEAENAQIKSAKLKANEEARVRQELSNPSAKYADINDPGERAYQILVDLGMVEVTPDPEDASYDSSKDNEFV